MRSRQDGDLVFSTDRDKTRPKKHVSDSSLPAPGPCKMRLETKGRGGKAVTVLFNLPFSEADARKLMRELQSTLACGATFKNYQIELRGDVRARIEGIFAKKQLKIVRSGA